MKSLLTLICVSLLTLSTAMAERPTAPQLFPDATYAYVRVDDASDLIDKWSKTSSGRLFSDPEVRPLVQEMYGSLLNSTESLKFEERFGMTLDELLAIFNGEAAIALMPGPEDAPPTLCFLIEAKGQIEQLNKLLQSALDQNDIHARVKKTVNGIELTDCVPSAEPNTGFAYFINQDVLVGCNSREGLEELARIWTGHAPDHKPLAKKSEFLQIMTRCAGMQGERPQISFYVDPFGLAKDVSKSSPGSSLAFAMLTSLGVDGIKGIGGSFILAPNDFDSISHFHLLMGTPRRVLLSAVRPKEGPVDPETWVSEEAASYLTINWQTQQTIGAIKDLVNTFNTPEYFDNAIKSISSELDLNFQTDVLNQLDDRISLASYFVRPLSLNSQSNVYAVKLKNASKFQSEVLPKLVAYLKKRDRWVETQYGSHQIFHLPQVQPSDGSARVPDPAMTVFDDRLIASDSLQALQQACDAFDSGSNLMLDSIEYKIVKQRIVAQTKGIKVCGLTMSRPEESLRTFYDMAADPKNKDKLGEMAAQNPLLKALHSSLTKHPLPPFDVIRKHLTPTGGYISEDDSGLHLTSFGIKRKK